MESSSITEARPSGLGIRVMHNTLALLGGRGLNIVLSGAAAIVLARYLGSERLGQYGALYAYLSLFGWLATFGLEPILAREASRQRELAGSILFTGVILCAGFSLGTAVLALAAAPYAGYGGFLRVLLVFAAVDILILSPLRLPGLVFQVDLRQWWGVGINVIRLALWLSVVTLLALIRAPLLYVVLGRLGCALVEASLTWYASRRFLRQPWHFLPDRALVFLRHASPIALSALLASVYLRIDQVMLHSMTSDRILGGYVAAVKISELFEMLPAALLASLFPLLAVTADQEARFWSYVDRSFRYLLVLGCGFAVFITLGARMIVALMYGPEYGPAASLLAILIWSEVAVFFGTVVANALIASGLQRFLLLPNAVGAGANILLNLALIPRYGAAGAAWSTLASYSLPWALVLLPFRQTRSLIWRGLRLAIPVGSLAVSATAVASILHGPTLVRLATGIGIYGLGIGGLRMIHSEDLAYVWAALGGSSSKSS